MPSVFDTFDIYSKNAVTTIMVCTSLNNKDDGIISYNIGYEWESSL